MSLNEHRHVETATPDSAPADIDRIEQQARATVVIAREESLKAESTQKPPESNSEASVYGALAMEVLAPGLGLLKVADFLDTRRTDKARANTGEAKTMEQHIVDGATRIPGLYRESVTPIHYEGQVKTAGKPNAALKKFSAAQGEDLMARANIAETSLKGQSKEAIGSWGVGKPRMDSVDEVKKRLTLDNELASGRALDAAHVARLQQQATMQKIELMAPGMGMGMNGPSMKMSDVEKLAAEEQRMNQWRESGTA